MLDIEKIFEQIETMGVDQFLNMFRIVLSVIMGPVAAATYFPIILLIRRFVYLPIFRKSLIQKAIRKGHTVEAYLDNSGNQNYDVGSTANFIYVYKNRDYVYEKVINGDFQSQITLYWLHKPRKATEPERLGNNDHRLGWFYIILSALLSFVVYMLIGEIFNGSI